MATSEVVKPVSPLFPLGQIGLLISKVFDRAAFAKVFAYLFALVFVFAFEVLFKLLDIMVFDRAFLASAFAYVLNISTCIGHSFCICICFVFGRTQPDCPIDTMVL